MKIKDFFFIMLLSGENMPKNQLVKSQKSMMIPQSVDAEEAVLGAILTTPESFMKVADVLRIDDFYKPANKLIYEAISKLTAKSEPVDIVTVSEKLKDMGKLEDVGGRDYVTDLAINSVTSANIMHYCKIIKDTSTRRNLIMAGSEIVNMAYQTDSPDLVLDVAQKMILGISTDRNNSDVSSIQDLVVKTYEQVLYRYEHAGELSGTPTGFYDLDALTSGLQKSNLIILAGRPSMGKTALALNIAQNVGLRSDKAVIIFSLEMSEQEITKRLLSSEAEVDARKLTSGHLQPQDWTKLTEALPKFTDNRKIYIDDTSSVTVAEVRAKCRRLVATEKNLGLIVIDYLQLMQGSTPNPADANQEITVISRGLKTLARELDVPIIALSQLSRSSEKRNEKLPMLSDLRGSGAIEQDADIVMFIHRDEYYDHDNPDVKGKAQLIIAKNRSGPVANVELAFQSNITKFKNLAKTVVFDTN